MLVDSLPGATFRLMTYVLSADQAFSNLSYVLSKSVERYPGLTILRYDHDVFPAFLDRRQRTNVRLRMSSLRTGYPGLRQSAE